MPSQAEYSGVLYESANKPRHLSRVCSKTTTRQKHGPKPKFSWDRRWTSQIIRIQRSKNDPTYRGQSICLFVQGCWTCSWCPLTEGAWCTAEYKCSYIMKDYIDALQWTTVTALSMDIRHQIEYSIHYMLKKAWCIAHGYLKPLVLPELAWVVYAGSYWISPLLDLAYDNTGSGLRWILLDLDYTEQLNLACRRLMWR